MDEIGTIIINEQGKIKSIGKNVQISNSSKDSQKKLT